LLASLAMLLLTWGLLEVGSAVLLAARYEGWALPRTRLLAENNAYVEDQRSDACSYGDSLVVHPFLAHTNSALGRCGWDTVNKRSLIGRDFPDTKLARTGVILVTGGSVAAQFTWDNRETPSHLERILNEEFVSGPYERFIVLNGGHGAWKHPNQYILFGLYADVLDGVITLDGFNEHYMIGSSQRFELPSNSFFQTVARWDPRSTSTASAQFALKLEADLFRTMRDSWPFHYSSLLFFVGDSVRRRLRDWAEDVDEGDGLESDWLHETYARMFDLDASVARGERAEWQLAQYEKYIRLIHAGAQSLGIPSLFVLQPTPAIGKRLSDAERPFAEQTKLGSYEAILELFERLRGEEGLPAHSLGDVFADETGEIYRDHIHVNDRGNQLMARAIADIIEREWGWPRRAPASSSRPTP
jgi:hypothetical protein